MSRANVRKGRRSAQRAPEPHEMTADELDAACEAATGFPVPRGGDPIEMLRWLGLAFTQLYFDWGIALKDATRISALQLLAGNAESDDIRTVFGELMGRPVSDTDRLDAKQYEEILAMELEFARAMT